MHALFSQTIRSSEKKGPPSSREKPFLLVCSDSSRSAKKAMMNHWVFQILFI